MVSRGGACVMAGQGVWGAAWPEPARGVSTERAPHKMAETFRLQLTFAHPDGWMSMYRRPGLRMMVVLQCKLGAPNKLGDRTEGGGRRTVAELRVRGWEPRSGLDVVSSLAVANVEPVPSSHSHIHRDWEAALLIQRPSEPRLYKAILASRVYLPAMRHVVPHCPPV